MAYKTLTAEQLSELPPAWSLMEILKCQQAIAASLAAIQAILVDVHDAENDALTTKEAT